MLSFVNKEEKNRYICIVLTQKNSGTLQENRNRGSWFGAGNWAKGE